MLMADFQGGVVLWMLSLTRSGLSEAAQDQQRHALFQYCNDSTRTRVRVHFPFCLGVPALEPLRLGHVRSMLPVTDTARRMNQRDPRGPRLQRGANR